MELADDAGITQSNENKNNVVRIFNDDTNEAIGFNFFGLGKKLNLTEKGQVFLDDDQVSILNDAISKAGFSDKLVADNSPKFVIGHVDEMKEHPDSDHLHITQTDVGLEKPVQIVCGAPNIEQGQLVVVALPGAVMPTGTEIWPGALRGVDSYGMICSAKELGIPNAPQKRGILVLDSGNAGEAFDFDKAAKMFD
ncbi:tRNA-binding domain-containing protein [Companilactobacillus tucceti DSM 20183]|uniref:tRNA-binding domain-containing protein n=1 Tax=Companilactobacillus tucceti DSM 20183 TaxID=1423811 RepID=A0A0R1JCU0_9LACO|nr:tRNA-binding domain-containing protein [Companilactobacillus tucceti DSM 20183]